MHTYFISNNINNLIKIGRASDINRRLKELSGQIKFVKLKLEFSLEGDYENALHNHYKDYRKEGEWFEFPTIPIKEDVELLLAKSTEFFHNIKMFNEKRFTPSFVNLFLPDMIIDRDRLFTEDEIINLLRIDSKKLNLKIRTMIVNNIINCVTTCKYGTHQDIYTKSFITPELISFDGFNDNTVKSVTSKPYLYRKLYKHLKNEYPEGKIQFHTPIINKFSESNKVDVKETKKALTKLLNLKLISRDQKYPRCGVYDFTENSL